jgi:hypothetical protein
MWDLTDLVTSATYTFRTNPNKMDRLFSDKQITTYPSSDGPLTIRTPPAPYEWSFGGNCRGKAMHDEFLDWFSRKHELRVSDHLSREFTILPILFSPTERRSHSEPWRFEYTVRSLMTDQYGGGLR